MRGKDTQQFVAFSCISPEERVPQDHPLRAIRTLIDSALEKIGTDLDKLYSAVGRPSIPPERLLRASLLQVLFSVRSEIQLMEQVKFNILFRWFVGLNLDDEVWDVTVYTKNRDRMMVGDISQKLLQAIVDQAREQGLLSEDHFTVDGTLIRAWANRDSFQGKDPATVKGTGARGRKLLRDTHESSTDKDARLYSKGGQSMPCYIGHVIIENRNGVVVAACATQASAKAESEAAVEMLDQILPATSKPEHNQAVGASENEFQPPAVVSPTQGAAEGEEEEGSAPAKAATLGADTAYQKEHFIQQLRERNVAPHVSEYEPNPKFPNWLTEEERQDPGFKVSQSKRKLIEKVFGWAKQDRAVKQTKLRGIEKVNWLFVFVMAAHNVVRIVKLLPSTSPQPAVQAQ